MAELTVSVDDNLHGAYGLLTSIADELQIEGEPLAAAVASAIQRHRGMFAGKAGLSQDKEVGLFGELLVLEYLINNIGAGPAVRVLAGPAVRGARLRLHRRASRDQDHLGRAAPAHDAWVHPTRSAAWRAAEPGLDPAHPQQL